MRLLLPLLTAAMAAGVDQRVQDLRAEGELRPLRVQATWSDAQGAAAVDAGLDRAWAAGAGLRWGWGAPGRPHLLVVGAAALWTRQDWDLVRIAGPLARVEAGYGHALGNRWLLTVLPCAGYGRQRLARDGAAAATLAMEGGGWEWGLRAGVRWSLARRWSLGAEGGVLAGTQRLRGDGAELTLRQRGASAGLSLAWTIDPQPGRVE